MRQATRRRLGELEQRTAGRRRIFVIWKTHLDGVTVDGVHYEPGDADTPEPTERDMVVEVVYKDAWRGQEP